MANPRSPESGTARRNAALALLIVDPANVEYLAELIGDASPDDFLEIRRSGRSPEGLRLSCWRRLTERPRPLKAMAPPRAYRGRPDRPGARGSRLAVTGRGHSLDYRASGPS